MGLHQIVTQHVTGYCSSAGNTLFPREDWAYEVSNGDTTASYEDWLSVKIEIEADAACAAVSQIFRTAPKVALGELREKDYAEVVLDCLSDLRIADDAASERACKILGRNRCDLLFGNTCSIMPDPLRHEIIQVINLGLASAGCNDVADKIIDQVESAVETYDLDDLDLVDLANTSLLTSP